MTRSIVGASALAPALGNLDLFSSRDPVMTAAKPRMAEIELLFDEAP